MGATNGVAYYFLNKSFILTLLNNMCGKLDGQQKMKDDCNKLLKTL